jgi:hypothetical protein
MEPIRVAPGKKDVDLGPINSQLVVENKAGPDVPPTTFSVSLEGEHSVYLPGEVVAPGRYWLYGVPSPVIGTLRNAGPSILSVYVDAEPEALGLRPAQDMAHGAAPGRSPHHPASAPAAP